MSNLKHIVRILLITIGFACAYTTSEFQDVNYSNAYTILIHNEGTASLNIYDRAGKLAWVFSGSSECVKLRSIDTPQQLEVRIGRSNTRVLSPYITPVSSRTGGWTWKLNDRLLEHSVLSLVWGPPCKF